MYDIRGFFCAQLFSCKNTSRVDVGTEICSILMTDN